MGKVRVCINGMTENEQVRGPVRYIYEIVNNMPHGELDLYLIAGSWQKQVYGPLEKRIKVFYYDINRSKVFRAIFFIIFVPWFLRKNKIEVYHIPDTNPLPLFRNNTRIVSTIHDCAEFVVPIRFSAIQSFYRRLISHIQAKYSDLIITVSNSSKSDIIKYHSIENEKIKVVYNGVSVIRERDSGDGSDIGISKPNKYILYVGVIEKVKNVELLVKAYAKLPNNVKSDVSLVLVGRKGNAYKDVQAIVDSEGLQSDVIIYGYLNDNQLANMYKDALLFVYVSEYEGFGLPILESMALGVPVLTSNKSSMKEIAGNAAILAETNVDDIKNKMQLLLGNEKMREEYKNRGFKLIDKFEWKKASKETCDIYKQLLAIN